MADRAVQTQSGEEKRGVSEVSGREEGGLRRGEWGGCYLYERRWNRYTAARLGSQNTRPGVCRTQGRGEIELSDIIKI